MIGCWTTSTYSGRLTHRRLLLSHSAYTIVEYLRHDTLLRQVQAHSMLKINNNLTASMARLFGCMHPKHKGLFEYRS